MRLAANLVVHISHKTHFSHYQSHPEYNQGTGIHYLIKTF